MTLPRHTSTEDAALLADEPEEAAAPPIATHWLPPRRRWPAIAATGLAALIVILAILAMWRLPPFGSSLSICIRLHAPYRMDVVSSLPSSTQ